ncbi:MAG: hypothetical protein ACO3Q3_06560 [Flavobacteriaceae bacterium]
MNALEAETRASPPQERNNKSAKENGYAASKYPAIAENTTLIDNRILTKTFKSVKKALKEENANRSKVTIQWAKIRPSSSTKQKTGPKPGFLFPIL